MRSVAGVMMALVAVLCASPPSFAQPTAPPSAAAMNAAAPDTPLPAAAPAPPPKRQAWKEWLDREPAPASEQAPARSWYGWQTLLVDGIAMSAVVLTAATLQEGYWIGIGMLMIGSPIVHLAHMNIAQGLGSLAIRAVSTGMFGLAVMINQEREGILPGLLSLIGGATAIVLDAAFLAWDAPPREAEPRTWLMPWLDSQHGRIGLGYAASF